MAIDRTTPIGAPVLADVARYPEGYAWGEPRSDVKAAGTLWGIEGDAGLSWCFVKVDDPGDGPAFMHVPMDRVDSLVAPTSDARMRFNYTVKYDEHGQLGSDSFAVQSRATLAVRIYDLRPTGDSA